MGYNDRTSPLLPEHYHAYTLSVIYSRVAAATLTVVAVGVLALAQLTPNRHQRVWFILATGIIATAGKWSKKSTEQLGYDMESSKGISSAAFNDNQMARMTLVREPEKIEPQAPPFTPVFYDWRKLKVEPGSDNFKPRIVIAETGSGKTTLMQLLFAMLEPAKKLIITPVWQTGQFSNDPVIGSGRRYGNWKSAHTWDFGSLLAMPEGRTISDALKSVQGEFLLRSELFPQHKYREPVHILFDEWRSQQLAIEPAAELMKTWLVEARKLYMVFWVVAQLSTVKALGMEGEGDIRRGFTWIRLGSYAKDYALDLQRENPDKYTQSFVDYVHAMERPCLVDDQIGIIPQFVQDKVDDTFVDLTDEVMPATIQEEVEESIPEDNGIDYILWNTARNMGQTMTRTAVVKSMFGTNKSDSDKLTKLEVIHGGLSFKETKARKSTGDP